MPINYQLNGLHAVVTGGTRGIGLAIANQFLASDAKVTITGREIDVELTKKFNSHIVDFTDLKSLALFIDWLHITKPDILINNAGINKITEFSEINKEAYTEIQQINIDAPFQLCQAVLAGMKEKRWGRIVNIGSLWGSFSKKGRGAYTISKFALNGLTTNLAIEAAPHNILVNTVAPGFTDTTLTRKTLSTQEIVAIEQQIPMQHLGKPEDIAGLVSWLVSRENNYLTGQVIAIDGGFSCT